ncbi:MAG: RNA methyltransferase [Bacteroidia bacterium]
MLSKRQLQFVNSLKQKKNREENQLFVAEGGKLVHDLLNSDIEVTHLFATESFFNTNTIGGGIEITKITQSELERLSSLVTPNEVIAICKIPSHQLEIDTLSEKLVLVLDDIRDPGNMGTIIRIADWYGIETIICSTNSADIYNSKVVQSTMGSIARIHVHYIDLDSFFKTIKNKNWGTQTPIYGALLEGENIYNSKLSQSGFIVIGNESKGISDKIVAHITNKIKIPSFSHFTPSKGEAESLNAAIATAIICSEFRRR